jgi:hypothetical protein
MATLLATTINVDSPSITMGGTTNAEGIRMQATNSTTYPVFLRAINPSGGGETSPWIYKEAATDWGIWHNNPINSIDFTKNGSGGIASNVGGSSTNTVTTRIEMATGYIQTIAGYRNSAGTTILDNSGNITGNAATASLATTSDRLTSRDNRTISSNEDDAFRLRFGFTSWANNNSSPYADYLHLRSYSDASGGNDNLVMFRKDAIGMRIYQAGFGTSAAYSTFKDMAFTDGTNATGTWGIGITGNAGSVTNGVYTTGDQSIGGTKTFTRINFGATGATPYSSAAGEGTGNGITFGGDEAGPGYRIFTGMENIGGNYSKLTLNWHTGIRIGAYVNYGGVRFYNNAVGATNPVPSKIFSVGEGDDNVRVYNELIVSGLGTSAYNILKYGGIRSGDWQSFTNLAGQINVIQVNNITGGSHTNYPTGVYGYGGVLSWKLSSHSFQLYAAHTGDLAYKTQWDNDNYSGWRRILDSTNYIHAANMNQYVRTTDSPTFVDVFTTGNLQIRNSAPTITFRDTNERTAYIHVNSNIFYVLTGAADSGNGSWGTVANGRWPMELNLSNNNATFGADVNAISYTLTGGFQITHPGSGYAAFSNWVLLGTTGFYSSTNGAHIYPNNGSYGAWKINGTRGGWSGIEFDSGVSLMTNSNEVGFHRNGHGWQMWWSAGTGYIHKGNPGGGTQATILESSNYNSYAPTLTGTGASGSWGISVTGSSASCTGNAASATYAPQVSLTGLGTSTVNVNTARTAVYRNENGAGAALAYAPVLHVGGGDTMWQIQGTYGSSGNGTFYFRQGYNGSWGTWLTMLSSANYTDYTVTKTGGGASGSWGINITGSSASCTGNSATVTNGIYTTSYWTGTPLGKRRNRIHSSDGTSLNSSITNLECGFTYGGSGEPTGPFIAFGGLGGSIDYSCQLVGAYSGGGNDFKIRTRNDDTAAWNTWRTIVTDGNYTSYSPSLTGSGASGNWGINVTGSSASCTGNAATATLATKASTLSQGGGNGTAMTFNWSGQSGQPTWLWGSNDGTNIYVWNPSNFNVNSAASVTGTVAIGNGGTGATTATNARTNLGIDARIRAWCHFDGTPPSATTLNANFNVSSVTKNGTGDYTVNFTSAIGNTTYVVAGTAQLDAPSPGQSNYNVFVAVPRRSGAQASGSCRVVSEYPAGVALYDSVIFRVAFIAA